MTDDLKVTKGPRRCA